MRKDYNYEKLTKAEQLECISLLRPLIDEAKAKGLKLIPREVLLLPSNKKALAAKQELALSLCSLVARICTKVGIKGHLINEAISSVQPVIDRGIMLYDPNQGSAFSSFIYLRLYGACIDFVKAQNLAENLVDDTSVFEDRPESQLTTLLNSLDYDDATLLDFLFNFSESEGRPSVTMHNIASKGLVISEDAVEAIANKLTSLSIDY